MNPLNTLESDIEINFIRLAFARQVKHILLCYNYTFTRVTMYSMCSE